MGFCRQCRLLWYGFYVGSTCANQDCFNRGQFWRARIRWGRIDQASRCEVGGHRRSNKSTPEARTQDMPPHFLKS
eukprot:scaffold364792_cov90-Attheya_sp.AAC.1